MEDNKAPTFAQLGRQIWRGGLRFLLGSSGGFALVATLRSVPVRDGVPDLGGLACSCVGWFEIWLVGMIVLALLVSYALGGGWQVAVASARWRAMRRHTAGHRSGLPTARVVQRARPPRK